MLNNSWLDKDSITVGQNFKLKIRENPQLYLDPDTYCPLKQLKIDINVIQDGQHDGRAWTDDWIKECEEDLIEEIMYELTSKVKEFVKKTDPFNIHKC